MQAGMQTSPFQVVKDFEKAVAEYCGAPYCVAVNSCTSALFLAMKWVQYYYGWEGTVIIPSRTYISVPMQIRHVGFKIKFEDIEWSGVYQLKPLTIFDCARRFTSNMYWRGEIMCTSHHWNKTLGLQQGGCILHDDPQADSWLRKARFDGRTEGLAPSQDRFDMLGWHMYLSPEIAAQGLVRLAHLPRHNADMPNDDYPHLSKLAIFGGSNEMDHGNVDADK